MRLPPALHGLHSVRDLRPTRLRSGCSSVRRAIAVLAVPGLRRSLSMPISESIVDAEMAPLLYFVSGIYVRLLDDLFVTSVNEFLGL